MGVVIGVLKETVANQTRVAVVSEIAAKLQALGARILLERGAGIAAHFPDAAYAKDVVNAQLIQAVKAAG